MRYDLPADDEDAFVACAISGRNFLPMIGRAPFSLSTSTTRAEVHAIFGHAENAAAHAIQWFEDDVAVLGMKALEAGFVAGDQRRRGELRKF